MEIFSIIQHKTAYLTCATFMHQVGLEWSQLAGSIQFQDAIAQESCLSAALLPKKPDKFSESSLQSGGHVIAKSFANAFRVTTTVYAMRSQSDQENGLQRSAVKFESSTPSLPLSVSLSLCLGLSVCPLKLSHCHHYVSVVALAFCHVFIMLCGYVCVYVCVCVCMCEWVWVRPTL